MKGFVEFVLEDQHLPKDKWKRISRSEFDHTLSRHTDRNSRDAKRKSSHTTTNDNGVVTQSHSSDDKHKIPKVSRVMHKNRPHEFYKKISEDYHHVKRETWVDVWHKDDLVGKIKNKGNGCEVVVRNPGSYSYKTKSMKSHEDAIKYVQAHNKKHLGKNIAFSPDKATKDAREKHQ